MGAPLDYAKEDNMAPLDCPKEKNVDAPYEHAGAVSINLRMNVKVATPS
jgi:hypothetical protein